MLKQVTRSLAWALAAIAVAAACGGGGTPIAVHSPSPPLVGALSNGLIAYETDAGIGVLDPATGKSTLVAPMPAGAAFRVSGPVWAPAPGVSHPVIYFTIHDDRPAENRTSAGVVPYDWLFRVDPFTGVIDPVAASADSQSEGPIGLVANAHYLALTVGCCASYEVDALDLTQPSGALKVLSKPPAQTAFFTEGAAPGDSGLLAVREFGTGAWYWLNADAGVLNPFPLTLGPDDGPVAITADGTLAAVSLPDHGVVIEPINSALPLASPSPSAAASAPPAATPSVRPATPAPSSAPRHVNSHHPHVDALAWSPDAKSVAFAVGGELQVYSASAPDGTQPSGRYFPGGGVLGVDWSAPITSKTLAMVKASQGPQSIVDGLLNATKLPAAADTPAGRPQTKVYLWQFDSTKPSPISAIADATPAVLAQYPPLAAGVVFHHWAPSTSWELLGGCFRYRVVITGSVAPTPSTVGLATNSLCSEIAASPKATASPSATTSPKATPSH